MAWLMVLLTLVCISLLIMAAGLFFRFIIKWLLSISQKRTSRFMKDFGQVIGFGYQATGDATDMDSKVLCPIDPGWKVIEKVASDVLSGKIGDAPCRIYDLMVLKGSTLEASLANRTETFYTVFELTLSRIMPDTIVTAATGMDWLIGKISNLIGFGGQVKLEGDFYKHFVIYVPRGVEVEAYKTFSPDVMMKLEEGAQSKVDGNELFFGQLFFELSGNKLYIPIDGIADNMEKMSNMFEVMKFLAGIFNSK